MTACSGLVVLERLDVSSERGEEVVVITHITLYTSRFLLLQWKWLKIGVHLHDLWSVNPFCTFFGAFVVSLAMLLVVLLLSLSCRYSPYVISKADSYWPDISDADENVFILIVFAFFVRVKLHW